MLLSNCYALVAVFTTKLHSEQGFFNLFFFGCAKTIYLKINEL